MQARLGIGLFLVLTACGGASSPAASADCREPVNGVITVTAESLAFDTTCLVLPAGEAVTIILDNADNQPHNVAIYTDSTRATQLFSGEIIEGGELIEYAVQAMEAGTYYFDCTVHPQMSGSVVVE